MTSSIRSAPIQWRKHYWNSLAALSGFRSSQIRIPIEELPEIIAMMKQDALGEFHASGLRGFL